MKEQTCILCGVFPRERKALVCARCTANKPLHGENWTDAGKETLKQARLAGQCFSDPSYNPFARIRMLPDMEHDPAKRAELRKATEALLLLAKGAFVTGEKVKELAKAEEKEEETASPCGNECGSDCVHGTESCCGEYRE